MIAKKLILHFYRLDPENAFENCDFILQMWAKIFHCDCKPATPQPMLVVEQNNLDIFYQRPKLFCIFIFFLKINIVILRIFVSFYNHNFLFQMRKRFANVNFYAKYESLKEK